jgi:hypothetical protein
VADCDLGRDIAQPDGVAVSPAALPLSLAHIGLAQNHRRSTCYSQARARTPTFNHSGTALRDFSLSIHDPWRTPLRRRSLESGAGGRAHLLSFRNNLLTKSAAKVRLDNRSNSAQQRSQSSCNLSLPISA